MRTFSFPLDSEQVHDLQAISNTPIALLEGVRSALNSVSKPTYVTNELESMFAQGELMETGLSQLLYGLRRSMELQDFTSEETLNAIGKSFEPRVDSDTKSKWRERIPILDDMLNSEYIIVFTKIRILRSSSERHIHSVSINTEIVPVFTADRSKVAVNIIRNVLQLVSAVANENENVFAVPLGVEDLRRMVRQAESALNKTTVLQADATNADLPGSVIYRAHP